MGEGIGGFWIAFEFNIIKVDLCGYCTGSGRCNPIISGGATPWLLGMMSARS